MRNEGRSFIPLTFYVGTRCAEKQEDKKIAKSSLEIASNILSSSKTLNKIFVSIISFQNKTNCSYTRKTLMKNGSLLKET